eukprot:jgi/Antlo1/1990/2210
MLGSFRSDITLGYTKAPACDPTYAEFTFMLGLIVCKC